MVRKHISKRILALLIAASMLSVTGCGEVQETSSPDEVTLIEPVGVSYAYEEAAIRNILNIEVTNAFVAPSVTELSLDAGQNFFEYETFPGGYVEAGGNIFKGDTEKISEQIKDKKKEISDYILAYEKAYKDNSDDLKELKDKEAFYDQCIENKLSYKPDESDPAYAAWKYYNGQGYDDSYDGYVNKKISTVAAIQNLELKINREEGLYNLDLPRKRLELSRLQKDLSKYSLKSTVDGYLVAVNSYSKGDWMNAASPVAAVGDMNDLEIRCDYISKAKITKALDVYAVFDGVRYEIDYVEMNTEEYNRIQEANGKALSAFKFKNGTPADIAVGQYGVVVREISRTENVVTVPKEALKKEDGGYFVYLLIDGSMVYTPVTIGDKDGGYVEIISGVEVGDKVITANAVKGSDKTKTLTTGTTKAEFSANGYFSYPASEWVSNPVEYGTTYLTELMVDYYQRVSKGDVIATVRVVPDTLAIQRKEQQLKRLKDRLEDYRKDNAEALAKDPELDKSIRYAHEAIKAKTEEIEDLEKDIAKMKSDAQITEIKAPYDGVIVGLNRYEKESLIYYNSRIAQIADETSSYIVVEDNGGALNYGNRATVSYSNSQGKDSVGYGDVVTINSSIINKSLQLGYSLIKIDAEDVGAMSDSESNYRGWWGRSNFKVKVTVREMNNVLLVPRTAVKDFGGSLYVKVKNSDGTYKYVGFVAGGNDATNYWVLEGLTEGMEICLG